MSTKFTIVQYNCGHSNAVASRALFNSFSTLLVLAIQEPAFNRHTKSTYCLKPYQLAYEALPETRVCFMINRRAGDAQWRRRQYSPNVATLELDTAQDKMLIINVYNLRGGGPRLTEWPRIQNALSEAQGEVLLLEDFNAYHLRWGGTGVACEQAADHLLIEMEQRDLISPAGNGWLPISVGLY